MRRWLTLIVLLLVVAACGGGGAADPEATGTDEEATESSTEGESMADFFGYSEEDPEAQEAEYREQEARIQESIRQCMAEAGFEYQPMVPPEGAFMVSEEWDEEEYVRTQGFGITTWYGNEELNEPRPEEEWVDPNQEMLEAMSESESTAWQEALYGTPEQQEAEMVTEVDPETGEEYQMMTGYGPGCNGEAYEAEYGSMDDSNALWEDLQPAMDAMYQQVQADPRIVELDQEWSACMAERGFEYESMTAMQEIIYTDFQTRFDEIVGPNGGYADPFAGWTQEEIDAFFEEKTQEEIDAFFAAAQEESEQNIDTEALEALQQEEIDLAVADYECRGDYYEVMADISEEYEADFIAENREALEQIRDAENGG
jgi:hypothetical protein